MTVGRTSEPRSVTVTTTSASAAVTGAAGTFVPSRDVDRPISGDGIPDGATLEAVASDTAATLSAAATASGSVPATIGAPGGPAPQAYGFRGWAPETEAEADNYTVGAVNAGTPTPDAITDSTTPITRRARTAS